ncbi:glycosyl hydrolase 2 galactose-binding domain-containing protein [Novipirellula artificiosorum]|uniref:Beta-D-glucuronidase n=1 Tax=Novipirellula artificiosorum TaxID=2528016 RepID=A0A5C6E1I3_9BACT|nr:glycoside hydrolase family 2 TIM barrel-domain containing protein [Novipirellula artificiosorum]TWU42344.1 beta-D-glucuronidase [Novipirellula artificiosorum]
MLRRTPALFVIGLMLWSPTTSQGQATPNAYRWIEGETGNANGEVNVTGWGNTEFLSEGQWLHCSIAPNEVDKQVADEGLLIQYPFEVTDEATYQIWSRIGFEFARSPFDWRIDDGEFQRIEADELTSDLMEIDFWCEVAWLQLGEQSLTKGKHRLEFRLPKTQDEQGKRQRILFALDAVCITAENFSPNSKYKPDEESCDDRDRRASKHVFKFEEGSQPGQRVSLSLKGLWEVCRDDEQLPGPVAAPIDSLPTTTHFKAIEVPGDKNQLRPDLRFAHRLWYRTRVAVPKSMAGRSFFLDFPQNNLNTTVYVNGERCGFEKNPFVHFQIDVSKAIRVGDVNEIWVGIRDAYYGRSADPKRPMKLRKTFNLPPKFLSDGFQELDYPIWNCPQSGILSTPSLIAAGGNVYTADVFVKPSVAKKRLDCEVTLHNPSEQDFAGQIRVDAIEDQTGHVAHSFAPQPVNVQAGNTLTHDLSSDWENPELWWPDSPHLYRLRVTLEAEGHPVDVSETRFGFREWLRAGTQFTLNGVVWHMWADLVGEKSNPDAWLEAYHRTHQRTMRMSTAGQASHDARWMGMEPHKALDFFDQNGVVVRRNTTLDGEKIGSAFSEKDAETIKQQNGVDIKLALMENWRDQCVAQVKGERNHPSIQIWTIENEFAYINLINLLGNSPRMDLYEQLITKTHDAVMAVDPTRSVMIDGGGATKENTLGVHGDHYVATLDNRYPDLAYQPFVEGGGRGRWKWDQMRPRFIGEDWYANGINPADYATWGGEVAFQGKAATKDAVALIYRMLNEGYRWGGHYAAWHFWLGNDGGEAQWGSNVPRAAFVRQWDWTFGSNQKVNRTFGLFNDTQYADPITFTRQLLMDGVDVAAKSSTHHVAPGTAEKFDDTLTIPKVTQRQEAKLQLALTVDDKLVFQDTKAVSILPTVSAEGIEPGMLAVWDPGGETTEFLRGVGVDFLAMDSFDQMPDEVKVLLIGRDAIDESDCTSTKLSVLAARGHAVVVLDQSHPLKYQAIPAEMKLAPATKLDSFDNEIVTHNGTTAFIEVATHPALAGLLDKDFFTWGPDHLVFRNAYLKPTRGAKSLIQCGPRLEYSALVELPVGQGVMFLSQLDAGSKLKHNVVAQHVVMNLLRAARDYRLEYAEVASAIADEGLSEAVAAIGLQHANVADAQAAISDPQKKIALVSATPESLKQLAAHPEALKSFWTSGGTIVLCGLTPEGLKDFNRIVGVEHQIRPFVCERVTFPTVRHPLTSGITSGDIVMLSGKRVFGWTKDEYLSSDVFSYVVDLDELSSFAKSNFFAMDKITNGFVGADGWPQIIDFEYPKDGSPYEFRMDLGQSETVVSYTHDPSLNYNPTTKIALQFDGKDRVEFDLDGSGEAQTFQIEPPRKTERVVVQLVAQDFDPTKRPLIGIDNIQLNVQRSANWTSTVKPMLNLGGLVQYAKGDGGVVLCNLKFLANETVPINQVKKRAILAAVLRNLKAPFSGGATVIAGSDLVCNPLDLHTKATTFKDERGWYGNKKFTFKSLPSGKHELAGVTYNIYDMPTSPVPEVIMLGGDRIPQNLPLEVNGIPANCQAEALFFLHTARVDRRLSDREKKAGKQLEICRYVIHYEDGSSETIPVISGIHIDDYRQSKPGSLPAAQLAWSAPYENSDQSAALFAMQWNNPHPGRRIATIDMRYGSEERAGVPCLIAVTAVTVPPHAP